MPAAHRPAHDYPLPRRAQAVADVVRAGLPAAPPARYDASMLTGLPEPARRWLSHALTPGVPLVQSAEFHLRGEIKLGGRWHEYVATQVLVPDAGFVWAARTQVAHLPLIGYDSYAAAQGVLRWRLLGLPFISGSGPGVTRSAADRLAAEAVLLPSCLVDAHWHGGHDRDSAIYTKRFGGRYARSHVTVTVAPDGRLAAVSLQRWGNPDRRGFREHVFRAHFDGEHVIGGITVPDGIHAAWAGPGDVSHDFFHARIDSVTLG